MALIKKLLALLLIAGLIIGGILYTTRKDAEYLDVRVNLTKLNDTPVPMVSNVTVALVPVSKVSEPKEGNAGYPTPGIIVLPLMDAETIGYWTAVPYNGTGTYKLKVGLTKYPKPGDLILLNMRIVDANGTEIQSLTYSQNVNYSRDLK